MATPTEPLDLRALKAPEATAQGESVVVIVHATVADTADSGGTARLTMTFEHAELLMARLKPAARIARQRFEQKLR